MPATAARTRVVNINREAYDVYIGRPGKGEAGYFGNPHTSHGPCRACHERTGKLALHGREQSIELYRQDFTTRIESDLTFRASILMLRGLRLGCFCAPLACHGDIIAAWIDSQPSQP